MRRAAKALAESVLGRLGFELALKGVERENLSDLTPEELETYTVVADRTMLRAYNVAMLCRSVEYVALNGIPGALVECGVWRGGAVMAMLRALVRLGDTSREVYLYDTFEGMTEPTEHDVSWKGEDARTIHSTRRNGTVGSEWTRASLEDVRTGVLSLGYPPDKIHFVVGRVEDTIPCTIPDRIALLRLDTDRYESTKHELEQMYPRLSRGGVLIIDDYGCWLGSKKATDDYLASNRVPLLLVRGDATVRYAVKIDDYP